MKTPLIKIKYKYKNKIDNIYAKLEYFNLTGSIKDRVVNYILEKNKDIIQKKDILVEATSGNTGISLASLGSKYKKEVHIFMPNWVSKERIKLMKLYGATVHTISKRDGGFKQACSLAKKYALENNGFLLNQFSNYDNVKVHYEQTGKEIIDDINDIGAFVSGIGTGGTIMGVGKRLKEYNPNTKIIAYEPSKMPIISNNKIISNHKIEGIGDDFIPSIVDIKLFDKVLLIDDKDAINMSKLLAKKLGLGVGISSGANFLASVLAKENINNKVVTIFVDDNKKYLSTSLSKKISNNKKLISNKIELIDYEYV